MRFLLGAVFLLVAPSALAQPESRVPLLAPPSPPPQPAALPSLELLAEADAALDRGELDKARLLYERIAREFAETPEAHAAERVLKALRLAAGRQLVTGARDDLVYQLEPYSTKTQERLRLSTWEKLDFGVTAFLYGASVGVSYGLANPTFDTAATVTPIVAGSLVYTGAAIAFLYTMSPDRGDLPLALMVSSYLPAATTLTLLALWPNPDSRTMALASVLAGVVAVPAAAILAMKLDLDPGDTQLVRDFGFWGMVLGITGAFAFHDPTICCGGPSSQTVGTAGMMGLYSGLGLGLLLAMQTEVTLERVRVTTWGGYGGAVIGVLMATAVTGGRNPVPGLFFGSVLGLGVSFLATASIDSVPTDATMVLGPRVEPALMPLADARGWNGAALGLRGTFH
ncbi:MAG: tetratricopeptide repeat protein [Myxococcota bacterium]